MKNIPETGCMYSFFEESVEGFFFVWYRPLKLTCQSSNDRSASAWVTIAKLACVPGVC